MWHCLCCRCPNQGHATLAASHLAGTQQCVGGVRQQVAESRRRTPPKLPAILSQPSTETFRFARPGLTHQVAQSWQAASGTVPGTCRPRHPPFRQSTGPSSLLAWRCWLADHRLSSSCGVRTRRTRHQPQPGPPARTRQRCAAEAPAPHAGLGSHSAVQGISRPAVLPLHSCMDVM